MGKHSYREPIVCRTRVPRFVVGATLLAAGTAMATSLVAQADPGGVNWSAIGACESGNNPATNTGNGFYGMYQFTLSTYHANGGVGMPQNASVAEQTRVAENVRKTQGLGAWPTCGRHAYDGGAMPVVHTAAPAPKHAVAPALTPPEPVITAAPAPRPPDVLVGPVLVPGHATAKAVDGDCVSAIAARNGRDWHHVAEANHLAAPYVIQPGQTLALD